ncbi:hypothetical protein VNN36_08120 [Lactococcus garvieae]|uniref:hypothetical protein n=1 Tax=Lactococcus garvieae TaxID=1363 RepID=UPI0030CBF0EE
MPTLTVELQVRMKLRLKLGIAWVKYLAVINSKNTMAAYERLTADINVRPERYLNIKQKGI